MKCREVARRMAAYVDNELEPALAENMSTHINLCPSCKQELQAVSSIDARLAGLPRHNPAPAFAAKVMDAAVGSKRPRIPWSFFHMMWATIFDILEQFFDLLQTESAPKTKSLEEFNDVPSSFIGHAYFKIMGC